MKASPVSSPRRPNSSAATGFTLPPSNGVYTSTFTLPLGGSSRSEGRASLSWATVNNNLQTEKLSPLVPRDPPKGRAKAIVATCADTNTRREGESCGCNLCRDPRRGQRGASRKALTKRSGSIQRVLLVLLTVVAVLPALSFLLPTAEPAPSRYVVKVVGRDFDWHFQIMEPATDPHVPETDRLQLPLDAEVELQITSEDYVYSLRIPEWGLHEVAVPGLVRKARFHTNESLDLILPVDPMCGFAAFHDDVMGSIVVGGQRT